ncbi:MAG: hypothetical protein NW224_21360 [Leptolyngbyaceae cyanobacterium bins.302]|nr:hypothetical protein [Leptolyngbyaceae cyanobacterium bins.302]
MGPHTERGLGGGWLSASQLPDTIRCCNASLHTLGRLEVCPIRALAVSRLLCGQSLPQQADECLLSRGKGAIAAVSW